MREFGVLSGVFMGMTLGVFAAYGLLAHTFRQTVVKSPAIWAGLRRGFAAAFAAMAGKLAWSDHRGIAQSLSVRSHTLSLATALNSAVACADVACLAPAIVIF